MSEATTPVANGGSTPVHTPGGTASQSDRHMPSSGSKQRRTTINASTGHWVLGKTIGAGSMGKVKLAKKLEGGEQVAVKIVPRQSTDDGHHSSRDRERADHSKEVRTAREAAIVTLLDHPYICAMRDVVRTNHHWYMLFEYVNGGQMLDYIISHGRLKEKQARKFGRQIASALDYCHRNSIVHRDLKIENILISKTGDIKIIDFGLSNLFSPRNHLKTFCGSLYFAAPELLQARQYTGPEVDAWSFGIVLYVLVCGKVPFDDQSMPQLHAKIKKGLVDYPQWLSAECKNLISRMLVTDPRQRASLHEIMNHPWMCKGFSGPPENYLPRREPLQLPLDPQVIQGMTGFDFGSTELITAHLTRVVESEEYQSAVRATAREHSVQAPSAEKKRGFPGLDFYRRRNSSSKDALTNPSAEGFPQLGSDPTNAFSPLISVYYLVREKQERDRLEANPGAASLPKSPGEKPIKVPDLPMPEAAHTNDASYEYPGEKPTGGRSRPRARTHGEDEITEDMNKLNVGSPVSVPQSPALLSPTPLDEQPVKKESAGLGILRRFSTRRHRDPDREKNQKQQAPTLSVHPPGGDLATTPQKSFSVRRARDRDPPLITMIHGGSSQPQHSELLTPPSTGDHRKRLSKGLGRSTSTSEADWRKRQARRGLSDGPQSAGLIDPPLTSGSDRSNASVRRGLAADTEMRDIEQRGTSNSRATTLRTKSLGHARRESIQARRARRQEAKEASLLEAATDGEGYAAGSGEIGGAVASAENVKPVYLKGLFSVATTSTKPVSVIRKDIIRVLKQLGVEYTEIRGGFSCKHKPSIDLNKVVDNVPQSPEMATNTVHTPGHRRRISFGGLMSGGDRDDHGANEKLSTPKTPTRKMENSLTNSDASNDSVGAGHHGARALGDTTTHVQSELGGSLILNFEIFIVKVPLLSLHGIQFKRLGGNTWQYKYMAEKILKELRL
ncbi:hypothetical protein FGG08_001710 [Glutinoglossum americanum]|uniref:non-specific serine/threonine protein kinase n=1 Tax=Glutinoglossum americanum TaxID=1670608 RepID=A0A9P8IGG5_9PEZI|nr:hypothetical protein FGG08_001710 [Glutinoglossum americanum]